MSWNIGAKRPGNVIQMYAEYTISMSQAENCGYASADVAALCCEASVV